jgi:hypothetical protein
MQVYPQVPPFPPGPSSVTLLLTPPPRRAAGKSAAACLVISTLHCPAPVAAVVRAGARAASPERSRAGPAQAAVVPGWRSGRRPGAQPPLSRTGPARSGGSAAHASGGPARGRKERRRLPRHLDASLPSTSRCRCNLYGLARSRAGPARSAAHAFGWRSGRRPGAQPRRSRAQRRTRLWLALPRAAPHTPLAGARAAGPARSRAGPARSAAHAFGWRSGRRPGAFGCRSGRRPGPAARSAAHAFGGRCAGLSLGPAAWRAAAAEPRRSRAQRRTRLRRPGAWQESAPPPPLLPHVAIFSCMSRSTRVSCIRPPSDLAYGEVKRFTLVLQTFNN